jgi:SAM-dependent methyltransferase
VEKDWYRHWFDSPFYDLLYAHRDEEEARRFIRTLLHELDLSRESEILDMACGNGRHTAVMAEEGYRVTGIDLSATRIRMAADRNHPLAQFFVHDMRYPVRVNYFDLVLNLFTSLGYTHKERDDRRVVASAAAALKKGGRLVIDFLNPSYLVENLVASEELEREGVHFSIEREIRDRIVEKRIVVDDGKYTREFRERVRLIDHHDFRQYFNNEGLVPEQTFGSYGLTPFYESRSERLIMICRKP